MLECSKARAFHDNSGLCKPSAPATREGRFTMASKFHGTFEVTADFVNKYVADDVELEVGDWVLVGSYRERGYVGSHVTLYSVDSTRRYALDFLGLCIRHDYAYRYEYDYELWHVVVTPEWMLRKWVGASKLPTGMQK